MSSLHSASGLFHGIRTKRSWNAESLPHACWSRPKWRFSASSYASTRGCVPEDARGCSLRSDARRVIIASFNRVSFATWRKLWCVARVASGANDPLSTRVNLNHCTIADSECLVRLGEVRDCLAKAQVNQPSCSQRVKICVDELYRYQRNARSRYSCSLRECRMVSMSFSPSANAQLHQLGEGRTNVRPEMMSDAPPSVRI